VKASLQTIVGIAVIVTCILTKTIPGQSNVGNSSKDPNRIVDADIAPNGEVEIRLANGGNIRPAPEKGQIACEQIGIDAGGHSVGWLVAYEGVGGTSYPIPTDLIIYQVGAPAKHFTNGLMLLDWQFVDDDKHVQFSSSQVHGPGADWHTMDVYDIQTRRLIKRWLEPDDYVRGEAVLVNLKGRVTDAVGAALPDASVKLTARAIPPSAPSAEAIALAITGRGGAFEIPNLQFGQYEIHIEHTGFQLRTTPVTIGPNPDNLDIGTVMLVKESPIRK
jgi:hypothetical protein